MVRITAMNTSSTSSPQMTNTQKAISTSCIRAMTAVTPAARPPILRKRRAMYTSRNTAVMAKHTRHFWKNRAPMLASTELEDSSSKPRSG